MGLASYPEAVHVIVSLLEPEAPEVRAWRIADGRAIELALRVPGGVRSSAARWAANSPRKAALPVAVRSNGTGRYPPEIEPTVYFCVLEALQNAAKYSEATSVDIVLDASNAVLGFEVSDDGRGFDPGSTPRGSGLQNMGDRLEAVGGALEIRSTPGTGTSLRRRIPVREEADP